MQVVLKWCWWTLETVKVDVDLNSSKLVVWFSRSVSQSTTDNSSHNVEQVVLQCVISRYSLTFVIVETMLVLFCCSRSVCGTCLVVSWVLTVLRKVMNIAAKASFAYPLADISHPLADIIHLRIFFIHLRIFLRTWVELMNFVTSEHCSKGFLCLSTCGYFLSTCGYFSAREFQLMNFLNEDSIGVVQWTILETGAVEAHFKSGGGC